MFSSTLHHLLTIVLIFRIFTVTKTGNERSPLRDQIGWNKLFMELNFFRYVLLGAVHGGVPPQKEYKYPWKKVANAYSVVYYLPWIEKTISNVGRWCWNPNQRMSDLHPTRGK